MMALEKNKFLLCILFLLTAVVMMQACTSKAAEQQDAAFITSKTEQDSLFGQLIALTKGTLRERQPVASAIFFVIPIQTMCKYCRNKIIDSLVMHQADFPENRYVIISAKGGRKTINSFFRERDKQLPSIPNHLFLDTTFEAHSWGLCSELPMYYYVENGKVVKKKGSVPSTTKQDLHDYFK